MAGDINVVQIVATALITAAASGGMNYLSFRGMFGEFKRDMERRVDGAEKKIEGKVDKTVCDKEHLNKPVIKSDCHEYQHKNEVEHKEIFDRLRPVELGLVAVKSQLENL